MLANVFDSDEYSDRYKRRPGIEPKFVRLHPEDDGNNLDDVFFEDPATFVPRKNSGGEVLGWGVFPYTKEGYQDCDVQRHMMRTMGAQRWYMGNKETPQEQFVGALIKKKKALLQSLDLGDLKERDYVLRITLFEIPLKLCTLDELIARSKKGELGEDMIYRRFKVSGGVSLEALQDKIIQPIMGWARNAHAFVFMDLTDGACFGPTDSMAIDMLHLDKFCYKYIDADKYTLAHLVQKDGTQVEYLYDFGDSWIHKIQVESISPRAESDGRVVVLDGRGMCPAEDGNGNRKWAESLYNYTHGTMRQRNEVLSTVLGATNYKGTLHGRFDALHFFAAEAQRAVSAALATKASVRTGPKTLMYPMTPTALAEPRGGLGRPKRGQTVVRSFDGPDSLAFMSETVSDRRDRLNKALCAACGSPNNLKACSGCRKIFYCGQAHQKEDWKAHKPECNTATTK